MPEQKQSKRLAGLIRLARRQRGSLIGSVLFAVAGQGAGLVPFFLVSQIITLLAARPIHEIPQDSHFPKDAQVAPGVLQQTQQRPA